MKAKMKVLSLFDGISCARVALDRVGASVEAYYASEIEPKAVSISQKNYPDIMHLGDVRNIKGGRSIDLLIGGSPCQDLSIAKSGRQGLKGERSGLFYEYLRILKETKPKYFILENVARMPKEAEREISELLGVEPIMIDAALVSAQNRKRLFWTNIPGVIQPEDRGIVLKDIIEDGYPMSEKSRTLTASYGKNQPSASRIGTKYEKTMIAKKPLRLGHIKGTKGSQCDRVYSDEGKAVTLSASKGGNKSGLYIIGRPRGKNSGSKNEKKAPTLTTSSWEHNNHLFDRGDVRPLTAVECERLQSLPDNYTQAEGVSKTARITALGNAFNVDVVAHILSHIPELT